MSPAARTSLRTGGAALLVALALAAGLAAQTEPPAAAPEVRPVPATEPAPAAAAKVVVWDGHRTVPVHLIPLRDENDEPIIPTEALPLPYSARFTCGPCHDYATIRDGWHFGAMTAAASGRPGEPWFQVDGRTGTVLPLSYRRWEGTYDPRALGLSAWDFTALFGRHMPGGGPAEPSDEEVAAEPDGRWSVSGKAEVNCLACHNRSGRQDPSEWAKQVLRENLRWAATDADVHAAAGLKCADCHRNDLGHAMVRGYEGEAAETGNRAAASFTCRGCHLGEDADGEKTVVPGRLGAPLPKHTGIPLVHFKRLACTVCHSGPRPREGFTRVRTSRANRLGIHGVATWAADAPAIVEPVYKKDAANRIAPQRLVWPAFWARRSGRELVPLKPAEVEAAAGDILKAEDHVFQVLAGLAQVTAEDETPVLVSGDFVLAPNVDAALDAAERPGAGTEAAFWGLRKGTEIAPVVPDFDPAAEDKDPAIETRFQEFLQALGTVTPRPGEPAIVVRKTLYRLVDGFLDASEAPAELAGAAGPGWLAEGKLQPLASEFDVRTVTAKAGTGRTLTEEQVALTLRELAKAGGDGEAVYVAGGRLFRLDKAGRLAVRKDKAAAPVTWPLAHDVRPAQQALGWKACTDCHSGGSDFFFDTIEGAGPLLTASVAKRSASSFMGLGGLFQRVFGLSFIVRPVFKIVLAICAFLIGPLLLVAGLAALGRVAGFLEKR